MADHGYDAGVPLATLEDIARVHDGFTREGRARLPHVDLPARTLWEDAVELIEKRPYKSALVAVAIGLLGGLLTARLSRPRLYSRGW